MTARIGAYVRSLLHRLGWRLWTYGRTEPFLVVEFPNGAEHASTGTVAGLIAGLAEWFNGVCPGVRVDADIGPTATFGCCGTHVLVCVREPAQPEADKPAGRMDIIAAAGEIARLAYGDDEADEGGTA